MNNSISSNALQTTSTYNTTGLSGTESYVWTLETATNGYYLKNVSLNSSQYLNNSSSTNVSFGNKSSVWSIEFSEGKALITNTSNSNRFLGYTTSTSYNYKAYATSNLSSYDHAIIVYQLVEDINTDSTKVNIPSISITEGVFISSKIVSISCSTDDVSIYYTIDGTDPTTESILYTEPFSISETTTIKAIATKTSMNNSDVTTQTFTKVTILDGINALNEATTTTSTDFYVNLANAQVTFTGEESTKPIAYLNDENAGIYVYNVSLTLNDQYNGVWKITTKKYNNLPEITDISEVEREGTSEKSASDMAPVELSVAALEANFSSNLGRQVKIVGFDVTDATKLTDNIGIYTTTPYLGSELTADKTYTLVGYPYINGTTKTFRVVSAVEVELKDNIISGLNDTYNFDLVANEGISSYSFNATATSGATVIYEISSTDIADSEINLTDNKLTVSAPGIVTIRAYVNSDGEYMPAEKIFTVYAKGNPTIVVGNANVTYGSTFTIDSNSIEGGDNTVTCDNIDVATVDGLVINPVAVGSVVITVNTAETNVYNAGSATFILTIEAPSAVTTAPSLKTVLAEFSFTNNSWNLPEVKTTDKKSYTSNGYTFILEGGGSGNGHDFSTQNYLIMGKSGATMTFPSFDKAVTQIDVVGRNGASTSVKQNIYVGDVAVSTETTGASGTNEYIIAEDYQDAGTIYTLKVTSSHNTQITAIKVYTQTSITAKLNSYGFATFCSQYPLDFSNAESYTAWKVIGTSEEAITFEKITGKIKGGQGVLLMGEANENITLNSADCDIELEDNLLKGTLAPTAITTENGNYTNFGLSGDSFVKINDGTIPAGKAYLPVETSKLPADGEARMRLVFVDETTGIATVKTVSNDNVYYNLAGQRVATPTRGIYIVNGKKVFVK